MATHALTPGLTGVQTAFPVPFEYLSKAHVNVLVNGVPASFTWTSTYIVNISPAPVGSVYIYRLTPRDASLNTYTDGSVLIADDLNASFTQNLFISQEIIDISFLKDALGNWDANNLRLGNVADAVGAKDVVNKQFMESYIASSVSDAAASAASALSSKNAAVASKISAQAAQAAAEAARNAAQSYATAAQTFVPSNYYLKTEVDSGFYTKSAMDTALAAKASLTGAETLTNKTLTSPTLNTPSLILKQSTNPTPTAEGDMQWDTDDDRIVVGDGAGQKIINPNDWVKIGQYSPSSIAALAITNLGAFKHLRLVGSFTCDGAAAALRFRVSADNGSTWLQGASDYAHVYTSGANNLNYGLVSATTFLAGSPRACSLEFFKFNSAGASRPFFGRCIGLDSNSQNAHYSHGGRFFNGTAVALNALQMFPSVGTFSADFYLEGLK